MIIASIKEVNPTYHDHRLRHYSSPLQQQHTTFSGHRASYQRNHNYGENILPPKKRVRSSGPDYVEIKVAATSAVVGELVDHHPSSFSLVVDRRLRGRGRGTGRVAGRHPLGPWDGWVCRWHPGAVYAGSLEVGMSCFTSSKA